jgi:inhibitor of cysteine peptidase
MMRTRIDESFDNRTVDLAPGATLELCLPETPSTGYRWQVTSDGNPACAITDDAFTAPSTVPSGSGEHCWTVTGVRAGDGVIALQQRRRWQAPGAPGRTFTLRVRVRS